MAFSVQALGDIDCFQLTGGENSCLIIFNGDFKSLHFSSVLSFSWPGIPWDQSGNVRVVRGNGSNSALRCIPTLLILVQSLMPSS